MKEYFSFQWHITDECDQRCRHCYIFSGDPRRKLDSMTWKQLQETFYNCLDFCDVHDRLPYFYLTGGDPILHPDFWRLLKLFHKHAIPFTIMGNPFHLNDRVCGELKSSGCQKYQLSLDGLWETHDWFRKRGSFDCTLEKIGCINRAGIRSVVMTTVSRANQVADSRVGSVFEDRLADVWVTDMEAFRNYDDFSKCSRCKLKQFCRGCPAVAKGTNGDFYGDDPQCWASVENGLLTPEAPQEKRR